MDVQRLQEIRERVDSGVLDIEDSEYLLACIAALKADMAKIRGLALQLTALSYSPAAIAGSEIYNLAAQHADEPEV